MITEDFPLAQQLFTLIDDGILEEYDAFTFSCIVGKGYIDTQLTTELSDVQNAQARHELNHAVLNELVRQLQANARRRDEDWSSFVMSYRRGEQVSLQFGKEKAAWDTR
ncbi:hypothetical protein BVH01_01475 [Pseudomonas sp. PA1(2017)]|uniref:hypothetical protein n=1 Tax=Pseudomonas sp. PA1(2017) TaxID=1932113 RepID=UPI000961B589|nr:hypothetical protein [Pseudomonas sp. PA1(2017)]OLU20639.1 hypothetical protein BVH01_01475 [Pseudomonas sp. PA1(2017)]